MSHTVVRLTNAEVTSELKADELTTKIQDELEDRGYRTTEVSIGDSTNIDGEVLLRAVTHHKLPSEADAWSTFLKKFVEANMARDAEDGEGFKSGAVVDEHDCQHLGDTNHECRPVEWVIK